MIRELAFTCYPVTDIPRARRFYEESLRLKLLGSFGEGWIEYDVGGGTFCITTMADECQAGARGAFVAFEVDDLIAELARLRRLGVKFRLDATDTPVCRFAIIEDPDGNGLCLHQRHVNLPQT
jgi:predicted enzyme related to lactoylglutathione lyase